jgi:hypothetical protein
LGANCCHLSAGPGWPKPEKNWRTIELCTIATLMNIISDFYKLFFHREHLVRKSMPSIMCKDYISTRKHS